MTGTEHLIYAGGLVGMSGREAVSRSTHLLDAVGLTEAANRRAGEYSAGMRQRLSLAQALINDPQVLVLDEPTAALDPVGRVEVLDLISSLAQGSTTVFMSTHLLGDVEQICDTVAITDAGRLVTQSSVDELRRSYALTAIDIDLESEVPELPALVEALPFVQRVEFRSTLQGPSIRVRLATWSAESRKATLAAVADHAGAIRSFHTVEPDLESVFLSLFGHTEPVHQA
jgi:ABC-2 type transport system ATP-binding protein